MYPFGYGLGYSVIEYSDFNVAQGEYKDGEDIIFTWNMTNRGKYNQFDVPQIYVHRVDGTVEWPYKELKQFCKVELKPGEKTSVQMQIPVESLKYWDESKHDWVLEPGMIELLLAHDAGDVVAKATCSIIAN